MIKTLKKSFLLSTVLNLFSVFGQTSNISEISIPPKQIVRIDYPLSKTFKTKIFNKSKFFLGISLLNRENDSLYKNLTIEKGGSRTLIVLNSQYLQFENRYLGSLKVVYTIEKGNQKPNKSVKNLTPQRAFYLENNTAQKIPLHIPGVMDPNLNPFSRSGVDLKNGQEIYLKINNKKLLILTVTDTIPHGARIDVASLVNNALNKR